MRHAFTDKAEDQVSDRYLDDSNEVEAILNSGKSAEAEGIIEICFCPIINEPEKLPFFAEKMHFCRTEKVPNFPYELDLPDYSLMNSVERKLALLRGATEVQQAKRLVASEQTREVVESDLIRTARAVRREQTGLHANPLFTS